MGHRIYGQPNGVVAVNMDGYVEKEYKSVEAAYAHIDAMRAYSRSHIGGSLTRAYHPRSIVVLDDQGEAVIERLGRHSTKWLGGEQIPPDHQTDFAPHSDTAPGYCWCVPSE